MILLTTTFFEQVIDVATAAGVLIAAVGLIIAIRSSYITTMHKCIFEYRKMAHTIQENDFKKEKDKEILKKDLLGLFNEQLFYCNKWYLPFSIRTEWKNTMQRHLENKNDDVIVFVKNDLLNFSRVETFAQNRKIQFN